MDNIKVEPYSGPWSPQGDAFIRMYAQRQVMLEAVRAKRTAEWEAEHAAATVTRPA